MCVKSQCGRSARGPVASLPFEYGSDLPADHRHFTDTQQPSLLRAACAEAGGKDGLAYAQVPAPMGDAGGYAGRLTAQYAVCRQLFAVQRL